LEISSTVPFFVALFVEPLWGWTYLKHQSVGEFIFSREGLVSHASIVSIIVTYLGVAFWNVHKQTKASWTDVSGEQLTDTLKGAVDFLRLAQFRWNNGSTPTRKSTCRIW
jgi:hypothetical protein